ncbi:hypothetical protein TNCV_5061781 [Trichonephila clavipes]|nr:hypothetical protein TNCV_5061781 [Trichonephila clavipes]
MAGLNTLECNQELSCNQDCSDLRPILKDRAHDLSLPADMSKDCNLRGAFASVERSPLNLVIQGLRTLPVPSEERKSWKSSGSHRVHRQVDTERIRDPTLKYHEGDGPRHFEPLLNDDTCALRLNTFSVYLHDVSSVALRVEPETRRVPVSDLNHCTAAAVRKVEREIV